jgi:hypothetical protein
MKSTKNYKKKKENGIRKHNSEFDTLCTYMEMSQ